MADESARRAGREYRLRLGPYRPDTMPMAWLAEYMHDLAKLLGHESDVHFVRLDNGSATLVHTIDEERTEDVRERVKSVREGRGPSDAMAAYEAINRRLARDNGDGVLTEDGEAEIIQFPGSRLRGIIEYGGISQDGSLDGIVIRLGGSGEQVPVTLEYGDTRYTHVFVNREQAKALGKHIYQEPIRVHGHGRWHRDDQGGWHLSRFIVTNFEVLRDVPLSEIVRQLRVVEGSEWQEVEDPIAELLRIRGTDEEQE